MADTNPVTPRLRVLTMNVYGPANPDWERRSRLLATTIRTLDPDIVALQEVPVTRDVLDQLVGAWPHRPHFSQPSVDGFSVCYQDAWEFDRPNDPGHTFDLENPLVRDGEVATAVSRKIDHILVRGGLRGPSLRVGRLPSHP